MTTPTIPRTSNELAEMLADPAKLKEVMASKDSLTDFITAYGEGQQGQGTDLQRQVDEAVQAGFADFLRENGAENVKRPDLAAHTPDPYAAVSAQAKSKGLYNKAAIGAKADGLFESSGDYFHAIWRGNGSRDTAEAQAKLATLKNFSSDVPADGGFLIPEVLRSELLKVALESAVVRPRARVIPMETLRVPFPAIDSTSNVSSVYGGITTYWTEEGGKLTGSKPKFGRVILDAKKLTAYTEIPNELLTDSLISLTAFVDEAFPEALAFAEDQAFLVGDGVGKPLGILNGNAAISVTRTTSSKIEFLDVINMYARMLPQSIARAVWLAPPNAFPQLAQMAMTRGTDGIASPAMWMTGGQAIDGPPLTLMGRPVIFTEKVPALGGAGDLSLVDFGFYLLGDRQAMQAKQSDDFKFDTDEVAFRVIERVDGRPWLQNAITPANGGDSLSPIVKLAA
ncbi:phage major capsid protein, HK97 family [Streptomyces sp. CBMAI 2042]|uniref:phage major capsid protein n=1 Tax=Streptomyces sp. CBMAI 2042 TaxID=2305222 RepID=UPI000F2D6E2C|nr:phage major capsid protein [Streptomyces sp. CBMAI 2042]RLV66347.1 phage major capsid protein, HK97 family [Streptomyces sp. CBMAI 2042]